MLLVATTCGCCCCAAESRNCSCCCSREGEEEPSIEPPFLESFRRVISGSELDAWTLGGAVIVACSPSKFGTAFEDQVLSNMQHKLDSLCAQISNIQLTGTETVVMSPTKDIEVQSDEAFGCDKIKFVDCGCWLCDQHRDISQGLEQSSNDMKGSKGYEILQYIMSLEHVAEQEERHMSDLSDMASSVTSAADFQLNSLAIEQDMYNLKRDCEEKDGTIRELTSLLHSSETVSSKRIAQFEDIIRRKNSTITRLKRDMAVLEQKVVHHARLQRSSYSPSLSSDDSDFADPLPKGPHMADNLLYFLTCEPSTRSSL